MPALKVRKQQDISAMIRAARRERGLSQSELAKQLAFSRDYLIDLESGKPNLYASRMLRVLHKLGVTMTLEYEASDGDRS